MPTCPGCKQRVSHDRLDTHERYCHGLHGSQTKENQSLRRLEERLDNLDHRLDRRLRALEVTVGNRTPGDESSQNDLTLLERDW